MRVETTETICDVERAAGREVAAREHVVVELDGERRAVDLCRTHARALRSALKEYLAASSTAPSATSARRRATKSTRAAVKAPAATRTSGRRGASKTTTATKPSSTPAKKSAAKKSTAKKTAAKKAVARSTRGRSAPDPRAIREWAQQAGIAVSARGRISEDVLTQFRRRKKR